MDVLPAIDINPNKTLGSGIPEPSFTRVADADGGFARKYAAARGDLQSDSQANKTPSGGSNRPRERQNAADTEPREAKRADASGEKKQRQESDESASRGATTTREKDATPNSHTANNKAGKQSSSVGESSHTSRNEQQTVNIEQGLESAYLSGESPADATIKNQPDKLPASISGNADPDDTKTGIESVGRPVVDTSEDGEITLATTQIAVSTDERHADFDPSGKSMSGYVAEALKRDDRRHAGLAGKSTKSGDVATGQPVFDAAPAALRKAVFGNTENQAEIRTRLEAVITGRGEPPVAHTAAPSLLDTSTTSATLAVGQLLTAEGAKPATDNAGIFRPTYTLTTPAGQPGWEGEIGDRVRWLVNRGASLAELRLNPPELGSVDVRVVSDGDRTSVTFFAQNTTARELLEAALPKLQDLFERNGLQLVNADVSEQSTGGDGDNEAGSADNKHATDANDGDLNAEKASDTAGWLDGAADGDSAFGVDFYV